VPLVKLRLLCSLTIKPLSAAGQGRTLTDGVSMTSRSLAAGAARGWAAAAPWLGMHVRSAAAGASRGSGGGACVADAVLGGGGRGGGGGVGGEIPRGTAHAAWTRGQTRGMARTATRVEKPESSGHRSARIREARINHDVRCSKDTARAEVEAEHWVKKKIAAARLQAEERETRKAGP